VKPGFLALALALALVVPSLALAGDELVLPAVTRTTLPNGLRVVVAEYHELPLLNVAVFVGAGAAQDPPGKEGLAMLTATTLKRGTKGMSAEQLSEAIESLGGAIGAQSGTDATIMTGEFLAGDLDRGLDLIRRVLREPDFARDEVRRAREEQLASLVAGLEEPSVVAERCFAPWLYGKHPYGLPPDGRRESVAELGRGDVRDFYDHWYRPNDTIFVLVGDVVADDAVRRIQGAFGDWQPRPDAIAVRAGAPTPMAGRRVLLVDKPDATQTQIRIGAIAMARNDPDLLSSQVANVILGGGFTSRLIEELRVKRSLTYGASSTFLARRVGGDFRIQTFTKTPTTVETLKLALEVEGAFRSAPLDPKLVTKAKTYMRGQYPLRLETPDAIAMRLAEIEFNGLPQDELETYRSRVAAVTPEIAGRAAKAHMPAPDDVAITVVGKASEIKAPLEAAFGQVTVVAPADCDTFGRK
jgi:zinc protease